MLTVDLMDAADRRSRALVLPHDERPPTRVLEPSEGFRVPGDDGREDELPPLGVHLGRVEVIRAAVQKQP